MTQELVNTLGTQQVYKHADEAVGLGYLAA